MYVYKCTFFNISYLTFYSINREDLGNGIGISRFIRYCRFEAKFKLKPHFFYIMLFVT